MIVFNRTKYTPMGHEQLTGLATAAGATPPNGARFALISVSGQPVRFRDDGTDPTAAIGNFLGVTVNEPFWYSGSLGSLSFIETAVSAQVDISYYS